MVSVYLNIATYLLTPWSRVLLEKLASLNIATTKIKIFTSISLSKYQRLKY
jgi:hypothetical protein